MPTVTLVSYDPANRTATFQAYGQSKTITGLGDFPSQKAFVEYLQSVAEVEMKPAQDANLPDMSDFIGDALPNPEELN